MVLLKRHILRLHEISSFCLAATLILRCSVLGHLFQEPLQSADCLTGPAPVTSIGSRWLMGYFHHIAFDCPEGRIRRARLYRSEAAHSSLTTKLWFVQAAA
jgi:hypothetical protein